MSVRPVLLTCVLAALVAGALAPGACKRAGAGGEGTGGGTGGEGGCSMAPEALFTVTIRAADGTVPADTTVRVTWSAGEEPVFALDDPSTWKTLDQANLVCDVDPAKPPPTDLQQLVCQLWTSGATRVEVNAKDYVTYDETLTPMQSDVCDGPVPSEVEITLALEMDAGSG